MNIRVEEEGRGYLVTCTDFPDEGLWVSKTLLFRTVVEAIGVRARLRLLDQVSEAFSPPLPDEPEPGPPGAY